jgi:NAD(P)H-hydrate epimerase
VKWVWPVVPARDLPALTADEMRQVDRVMIEDLGIELVQMMENAGLHLAELARSRFSQLRDVPVTVLAGGGNNGGGGLVCARHLANWGASVSVVLDRPPDEIAGIPAHQMRILRRILRVASTLPQDAQPTRASRLRRPSPWRCRSEGS